MGFHPIKQSFRRLWEGQSQTKHEETLSKKSTFKYPVQMINHYTFLEKSVTGKEIVFIVCQACCVNLSKWLEKSFFQHVLKGHSGPQCESILEKQDLTWLYSCEVARLDVCKRMAFAPLWLQFTFQIWSSGLACLPPHSHVALLTLLSSLVHEHVISSGFLLWMLP